MLSLRSFAFVVFGPTMFLAVSAFATETWIVRTDLWGNPAFSTLTIERDGGTVTGELDGDSIEGRLVGDRLTVTETDQQGHTSHYALRVSGTELAGAVDMPDTNDPVARVSHAVTGWRVPESSGKSKTIKFTPTDYSNSWNADRRPVLIVWPGDTIHTTTVDSGGVDEHGKTRALFGNPQTGPFFVAGAQLGDTLVVHIRRLKLNRDWADSLDTIVGRALGTPFVPAAGRLGKPVKWLLDRQAGRARPEKAEGALAGYSVPVKPMLGGLAVAPGFGMPAISTGDTGRFGGNMDFNEIVEGNTVYLPVQQPGACSTSATRTHFRAMVRRRNMRSRPRWT
ncbi:hypothetical protein [Xanthomonas phaseoli]|uniref:hypothetical protein n=1 Tax=Xanthomonas phaseoli TaxID=1985254 RepID=UPI001930D340|nr:hypothetical protein [Xanthomonas phaseoli]